MGFREEKLKMRRRLHEKMQVPALYLTDIDDYVGTEVTVRLHTKYMALGDQKGTSFNSAELEAVSPKIIVWPEQLNCKIVKNNVISVSKGEAYNVEYVEEPDGPTVTVHVTMLSAEESKGLPVPENA